MGYCEIMCQLCGVSFAIARLRRADEPAEAAWDYTGSDYVDEANGRDTFDDYCGDNTGCTLVERGPTFRPEDDSGEEHIAGPGCASCRGYCGYRISLEEMKGCRAVQCLIKKEEDWQPEADDQDFELASDYFLSGIGDGSPDESPLEDIMPARHGVDEMLIDNCLYGSRGFDEGLPFHPTCFEIFKKASKTRLGSIDVEGLWYWRELEPSYEDFFERFPRGFAVTNAREQWWKHEPGCEYLVANPVAVPGLGSLLKPQDWHRTETVFGRDMLKEYEETSSPKKVPADPFQKLPAEVASMVVHDLPSRDIANLRLAVRAFRELPNILFRRLLLEDMPWFWEVRDLPPAKTDWYQLYREAKSCWGNLKGLMNRKRIWRDVEQIVRRIERYRAEGKVGDAAILRCEG